MEDSIIHIDFKKNNEIRGKFKKVKRLLNELPATYNITEITKLVKEIEKETLKKQIR